MKRIFIVFSLLLALGVYAPVADAADSFDSNETLSDNLTNWMQGSNDIFFNLPVFGSSSEYDLIMLYAAPSLASQSSLANLITYRGFQVLTPVVGNDIDSSSVSSNFTSANYIYEQASFYMLFGNETLTYEWNGNMIDVVPGSIFMGLCLGAECATGLDMVLLLIPAGSAVPVPAAVWLFGSGMAGLAVLRRKLA